MLNKLTIKERKQFDKTVDAIKKLKDVDVINEAEDRSQRQHYIFNQLINANVIEDADAYVNTEFIYVTDFIEEIVFEKIMKVNPDLNSDDTNQVFHEQIMLLNMIYARQIIDVYNEVFEAFKNIEKEDEDLYIWRYEFLEEEHWGLLEDAVDSYDNQFKLNLK